MTTQAPHLTGEETAELIRSRWVGALLGIGLMAALDEILFHQILAWHHFYDRATPAIGLLSDGFLHAAELIIIVAGCFLFSELRRRKTLARDWAWAGFFLGAGGFQLFDGIVDHKLLQLHQVRYGVESILPYDLAWNGFGLFLICLGWMLNMRAKRRSGLPERQ